MNYKVGDTIKINHLFDEPPGKYAGRTGVIISIDDMGTLHGTWGGLGVVPDCDDFEVIKSAD